MTVRYQAVLFDLFPALLDSWSPWNQVAGDPETGGPLRQEYLRLDVRHRGLRPYEDLVAQAARVQGPDPGPRRLTHRPLGFGGMFRHPPSTVT